MQTAAEQFIQVPRELMRATGYTSPITGLPVTFNANHKTVYSLMFDRWSFFRSTKGKGGKPKAPTAYYDTQASIAYETGLAERTVRRLIKDFVESGVFITYKSGGGSHSNTVYKVIRELSLIIPAAPARHVAPALSQEELDEIAATAPATQDVQPSVEPAEQVAQIAESVPTPATDPAPTVSGFATTQSTDVLIAEAAIEEQATPLALSAADKLEMLSKMHKAPTYRSPSSTLASLAAQNKPSSEVTSFDEWANMGD